MSYRVVDAADHEGRRKPIARLLGAEAVLMSQFDSEPGQAGAEHDERESGQEEVYLALRGSGVLRVGDEVVELRPGIYVLVPPHVRRQVVAGRDGFSYLVVGAAP